MTFGVNDSPYAGTEGDKVTSRMIRDRLSVKPRATWLCALPKRAPLWKRLKWAGRGELQLGILIEVMRREGFELSISRPRVRSSRRMKLATSSSRLKK